MPGKRTPPMIGRLSELLVSGNRTGFSEGGTSPRSPLDYKIQSPRGLKNYDLGGVGLGIVAALDKSSAESSGHEIVAKYAICSPNSNRSTPIPVINSGRNSERWMKSVEMDVENSESYTYVTCHGPDKKSYTKVYYDGCEYVKGGHERCDHKLGGVSNAKQFQARHVEDVSYYPTSDFLSSCHLCKKKLHGKDIYMYRGEKAFCSVECRSRQIMMDERKEQCRSEVLPRSAEVSSSTYTRSPIFSTGIVAI